MGEMAEYYLELDEARFWDGFDDEVASFGHDPLGVETDHLFNRMNYIYNHLAESRGLRIIKSSVNRQRLKWLMLKCRRTPWEVKETIIEFASELSRHIDATEEQFVAAAAMIDAMKEIKHGI